MNCGKNRVSTLWRLHTLDVDYKAHPIVADIFSFGIGDSQVRNFHARISTGDYLAVAKHSIASALGAEDRRSEACQLD